jgi:hypothetical protein
VTDTEDKGSVHDTGADVSVDILTLVQLVMRECHEQMSEDLRDLAEEMRQANARKKALREYMAALRELKAKVIAAAHKRGGHMLRRGQGCDNSRPADREARSYPRG